VAYSQTAPLREALTADDPFVKKVLGKKAPKDFAAELIKGTKLKDVKVRKALFEGGKAAGRFSRKRDDKTGRHRADGGIANDRVFTRLTDATGIPDGSTVDSDGGL